jgi:hypothetical protein
MQDPFEESLRNMLKSASASHDDGVTLGRVLKTANRQVGAGDLFSLVGNWFEAFMIALNNGSGHLKPTSRKHSASARFAEKKAD